MQTGKGKFKLNKENKAKNNQQPQIDIAKAINHHRPNDLLGNDKFMTFLKKALTAGNEFDNYTNWSKRFAKEITKKQARKKN